jgi:hypothetical protein
LYHALLKTIDLSDSLNDTTEVERWHAYAMGIKAAANELLWDPAQGMYRDNETTSLAPQDGNVWAVLSNLTQSTTQIESISSGLAARWTPFGAPAPEAGDAICPFISGLELQVHMIAGRPSRALSLIRTMWGYMLEAPGMTGSTFIEGYAVDGSLHYAPYSNDPKVSHAHAWASGPTSILTFFVAGIRLEGPGGSRWSIEPSLGNLKEVEAGFVTNLGDFMMKATKSDGVSQISFETPVSTSGNVSVEHPGCEGRIEVRRVGDGGTTEQTLRFQSLPTQMEKLDRTLVDSLERIQVDNPERAYADKPGRIQVEGLAGGRWNVLVLCDKREMTE